MPGDLSNPPIRFGRVTLVTASVQTSGTIGVTLGIRCDDGLARFLSLDIGEWNELERMVDRETADYERCHLRSSQGGGGGTLASRCSGLRLIRTDGQRLKGNDRNRVTSPASQRVEAL
jgi:hypothetical protein